MIQRKLSTVGFSLAVVVLCITISALKPSKCYTLESVVDQVAIKEANDGKQTNKHEIATAKELTTISSKQHQQELELKKESGAQPQSTTSKPNSLLSSIELTKPVKNSTTDTTTSSQQNQQQADADKSSDQLEESLNIDRIEYDLLEYLEKLGARYRASNKSYPLEAPSEYLYSPTSSSLIQTSLNTTSTIQANDGPIIVNFSSTPSSLETVSSSSQASNLSGKDANEPETSEGSWQYGIFDRFTRARSTSTTQPPEPSPRPEDYRNFNTEECGLRYFDDYSGEASSLLKSTQLASPPAQFVGIGEDDVLGPVQGSSGASHSPSSSSSSSVHAQHDNQDNLKPAREKFSQINSFGESVQKSQVNDYDSQSLSHSNWPDPHSLGLKHDWNKELFGHENAANKQQQQQQQLNDDLNLSSRRNWRQQQIGQTLQSFGFNLTDLLTMRMNSAVSKRENLSKMSAGFVLSEQSASQKSGKSIDAKEQQTKVINKQDAGSNPVEDLKLEARVIGGTDARLGDSPWAVSLQALVSRPGTGGVEYRHYCGGTIISDRYILTAAHCLDFMVGRESRLFVVLGDLQWRMTTSSMYGRRVPIEKLIIHAGYKSTAFGHDIGLIKTKESIQPLIVKGRYVINRVCLPEKNVEHTGDAELVGWGLFSNRNEMADSLQIANVPILPRSLCVDLYRRRTGLIQWIIGIELITDKQICASTFGRGICQGDSGSPLVYNEKLRRLPSDTTTHQSFYNEKTRATIIGIVAFGGIRRCSYQSLPGVYMQTSKYMDWILPKII